MCGIARRRLRIFSSFASLKSSASPPERSTSRTSVCSSRYLKAASNSVCSSCSPTPLTTRLRVQ